MTWKTHWNYRVLAFESKSPARPDETETVFQICEVYYNKGKPDGYVENKVPVVDIEEGIKALKWVLKRQAKALKKPILWGGEKFPQKYKTK